MIIRAIFKGENGSMGYFKGSEYTLEVKKNTLYPLHSKTALYYDLTVEGFLANWEIKEVDVK